jgi:hypothetical protein
VYHILNYTPCPFTADIQQLLQDAGIMLHVKCKSLMPLDAFFEPGQKMVCKWDDATLLQMVIEGLATAQAEVFAITGDYHQIESSQYQTANVFVSLLQHCPCLLLF